MEETPKRRNVLFQEAVEQEHQHEPDSRNQNPQEACTPPDSPVEVVSSSDEEHVNDSSKKSGWKTRRRKQNRNVRIARVDTNGIRSGTLPAHQYSIQLRRRAIWKKGEQSAISSSPLSSTNDESPRAAASRFFGGGAPPSTMKTGEMPKEQELQQELEDDYDEQVGDVSLGMQLNIIRGKVIVKGVTPLADGRASPAQLTGMIQRGDVLLSIDGKTLVLLPIDQLMDRLKPLSSPLANGAYARVLNLRLASGEGLALLAEDEKAKEAQDMFSLTSFIPSSVPMVDQLSGLPLFDDDEQHAHAAEGPASQPVDATALNDELEASVDERIMTVDDLVSRRVAQHVREEKERCTSEFFAWNEQNSNLLKSPVKRRVRSTKIPDLPQLSKSEMEQRGQVAAKGAKVLFYSMEDIDKGKDLRSFKAWSTTLSLRSRASTRRRFVMDGASMIGGSMYGSTVAEVASDVASVGSSASGEFDGMTGDEILLHLAAHDEIWQKQVLETIETETKEMNQGERKEPMPQEEVSDGPGRPDIDSTLGRLFLDEEVSQMLKHDKKSYALPPEEVTFVFFDLVSHLASTTPDEISLKGGFDLNPQTSLVPFERSKSSLDESTRLATRFIVNDVFPAWLQSFKPLHWEERRVLWPHTKAFSMPDNAGGSFMSDDGLTLDSASSGYPSPKSTRKKDLRETIEDMELEVESRAEACFLLTFYFTHEIIPSLITKAANTRSLKLEKTAREEEAVAFVEKYGSYLKLPMSLAYAAFVHSEVLVARLLALAKYDLRHQEAMKETARTNALILYEPTMLSAIMKRVRGISEETKPDRRKQLVNLSVAAYPDLRPWQVAKAFTLGDDADKSLGELYYQYLCQLLHPSEGNDAARRDSDLVKEWCQLSIKSSVEKDAKRMVPSTETPRKGNFFVVANRKSPDHALYYRDLILLMELSMDSKEYDLFLELVDEMLDKPSYASDKSTIETTLGHMRTIGAGFLERQNASGLFDLPVIKRIVILLQKMADGRSRDFVNVGQELHFFLSKCGPRIKRQRSEPSQKEREFLSFLAQFADPRYMLDMLALYSPDYEAPVHVIPFLDETLKRGAILGFHEELSGSLIRIDHHRQKIASERENEWESVDDQQHASPSSSESVWRQMLNGAIAIEK